MTSVSINTINDLHKVRQLRGEYSHVSVDARAMKQLGLLRHAFKYAMWGLREGGVIEVNDDPCVSLLFSPRRIDFWQVRREFFKSVGRFFEAQQVDDKLGVIRAIKRTRSDTPNGVSFGIVYGGGERDTQLLCDAVSSIAVAAQGQSDRVELLVCGSVDEALRERIAQLLTSAPSMAVRYLPYEGPIVAGRIPIADKKNVVFDAANFDAVVISHTRISFAPDFVARLLRGCFDVLAPEVRAIWEGQKHRFLDYILVGSYDLSKRNPAAALGAYSRLADPLLGMKKRVPYVDGGVMIFNRQTVPYPPFDSALAWGEAEDVDACAKLYQQGLLIDQDDSLRCESSVVKFSPVPSLWFRMTWPLKRLLVCRGAY